MDVRLVALSGIGKVDLVSSVAENPMWVAVAIVTLAFLIFVILVAVGLIHPVQALTMSLVHRALNLRRKSLDPNRLRFRERLVRTVVSESHGLQLQSHIAIAEFSSQSACETEIRLACQTARTIKILTIRGGKYFLGPKSLLLSLCQDKTGPAFSIRLLVLSPDSSHITPSLAATLRHPDVDSIRAKMQATLDWMKIQVRENPAFQVKYYSTKPTIKLLIFDDIMFFSRIEGPKNDDNARMLQMSRQDNPLFAGLEAVFDEMWSNGNDLK